MRFKQSSTVSVLAGLLLLTTGSSAIGGHWSISDVGRFNFSDASISELSGLSWVADDPGGMLYYSVSDSAPVVIPLSISVDPLSGAVTSAVAGGSLPLIGPAGDQEGIGFDPATGSVFISNESEPGIRQHTIATGTLLNNITPASDPELLVFNNIAANNG